MKPHPHKRPRLVTSVQNIDRITWYLRLFLWPCCISSSYEHVATQYGRCWTVVMGASNEYTVSLFSACDDLLCLSNISYIYTIEVLQSLRQHHPRTTINLVLNSESPFLPFPQRTYVAPSENQFIWTTLHESPPTGDTYIRISYKLAVVCAVFHSRAFPRCYPLLSSLRGGKRFLL